MLTRLAGSPVAFQSSGRVSVERHRNKNQGARHQQKDPGRAGRSLSDAAAALSGVAVRIHDDVLIKATEADASARRAYG